MAEKTRMVLAAAALVLLSAAESGNAARILAMLPFPGKSHFFAISPLMEELARRGHQVTVVSPFPRSTPLANYTDLVIKNVFEDMMAKEKFNFFEKFNSNPLSMMFFMSQTCTELCDQMLLQAEIQKLIHRDKLDFDMLIYEPFMQECLYGFIHKLKSVPSVQISSTTISRWMGDGVGNPALSSFVPELILGLTDHMTFCQRLYNVVVGIYCSVLRTVYTLPNMEAVMRRHFGDDTPGVVDLESRASLLLLNIHPILGYPRPLTPNTVEVGGLHIKPAKKLPEDLQKWIEESKDGVLFFSLGSNAKSVDMPERMRNAFINAFSRMRQRILWKWEADVMPNQPSNVRIAKWIPQRDLLGHPNVKAAITHGGLLSTMEVAHSGVPVIMVPIMTDQHSNALRAQDLGYAIKLDLQNITEESVSWALNEVVNNPSYRESAKRVSAVFRDQPQHPLDRAAYWVEYMLRHGGAPHLHSAALDLNVFQYFMLDAVAFVALVSLIAAILVAALCRRVYAFCCRRRKVDAAKKYN